jgi:hypothetical protein
MNERASLVEQYAQRGWACFPLKPGGKQPATRSGVYAGTDDLVTLRRWWKNTDYNIGINCGASNLVVVDLDIDKEDGNSLHSGIGWWTETCARLDVEPFDTYAVVTASGGLHLYYELPDGVTVRSKNGVLAHLVDIKSNGGYVVAAGSEVDGNLYEWTEDSNVTLQCPSWLLGLVVDHEPSAEEIMERNARHVELAKNLSDDPVSTIRRRAERLASTPQGSRNETLNVIAFSLFEVSDPQLEQVIWDELTSAGLRAGLSEREINDTLRSAQRAAR